MLLPPHCVADEEGGSHYPAPGTLTPGRGRMRGAPLTRANILSRGHGGSGPQHVLSLNTLGRKRWDPGASEKQGLPSSYSTRARSLLDYTLVLVAQFFDTNTQLNTQLTSLLGAVWARTDEVSRGDVVGSRSPCAIACALRHAIGFRRRRIEGRHRFSRNSYLDQDKVKEREGLALPS